MDKWYKKHWSLSLLLLIALFLNNCNLFDKAVEREIPNTYTHSDLPNITTLASNTYDSTLRPIHQGVYDPVSNKTFFTFMRENSNPYVVSCDHNKSDRWDTTICSCSSTLALLC